jgi:predicted nucleotidyltransferase
MTPSRSTPPGLEELRRRRPEILAIATARGASNVRVFGSVVRGEQDHDSDLDLIVDMDEDRSLFDLGGLAFDLEELLGCAVDVGLDDSFNDRVREQVLAEAVAL